jgi:hypothetical protein
MAPHSHKDARDGGRRNSVPHRMPYGPQGRAASLAWITGWFVNDWVLGGCVLDGCGEAGSIVAV